MATDDDTLELLEELYRRHVAALYTLAYRITGSAEDAEDVLQDLFVGLPRALATYKERVARKAG